MTGSIYAKKLLLTLGAAVAWLIGFPLVAMVVGLAAGCGGVGGGCGAVALVSGLTLLPLGFLVIFGLLTRIVGQRLSSLGAPGWWSALLLPLFLLGDPGALLELGGHWSVGFSLGGLTHALPWRLIAGVATVIFLGAYPSAARLDGWTPIRAGAFALLTFLSLSVAAQFTLSMLALRIPDLQHQLYKGSLNGVVVAGFQAHMYACVALLACYGWLLWAGHRANGSPDDQDMSPAPPTTTFGRRGVG